MDFDLRLSYDPIDDQQSMSTILKYKLYITFVKIIKSKMFHVNLAPWFSPMLSSAFAIAVRGHIRIVTSS